MILRASALGLPYIAVAVERIGDHMKLANKIRVILRCHKQIMLF